MLTIRPFRPADAETVWELHNVALRDAGAHAGNGPWDEDLKQIPEAYADGVFLVGKEDGRIVAMGGIQRLSPNEAEVKRMRVHPEFQRRGFGRRILERLESEAARLGVRTLKLHTTTLQVPAQKLYEKHGYRETGRSEMLGFKTINYEKEIG